MNTHTHTHTILLAFAYLNLQFLILFILFRGDSFSKHLASLTLLLQCLIASVNMTFSWAAALKHLTHYQWSGGSHRFTTEQLRSGGGNNKATGHWAYSLGILLGSAAQACDVRIQTHAFLCSPAFQILPSQLSSHSLTKHLLCAIRCVRR